MAAPRPATCTVCELHAEAVFRVEGMDCHEEVVILERRLKPLAGVEALSADLVGQRLHVKYDAARLTPAAMVDAVGQTGMRMWLEQDEPAMPGGGLAWRARLAAASALMIAAGLVATPAGHPTVAAVLYLAAALTGVLFPARRAVVSLRSRSVDIHVLMVIAVAGALLIGEWLEAASVVCLFAVAQWLEVRTMERARQAIRALVDLSPREALVVRDGRDVRLAVADVAAGDVILLRPGDRVPLDGIVVDGHSDLNEAPLTGESLPVDKAPGDEVYAGTIVGRGALRLRVTRVVRDTRLARIIHLVETAQASRAPVQSFVDRFARVYTPVVIAVAAAVALVPLLAGTADPLGWIYRSLVLLVIACPCALVISTPVSLVAALSAAARAGVLVKGGAHLERLAAVRVVAFDKTGTLTHGRLRVSHVEPIGGTRQPPEILRLAAAVEQRSEHPVARAIVEHAERLGLVLPPVTGFASVPGMGAHGTADGRGVVVGNARMLALHGVPLADCDAALTATAAGSSEVLVAIDHRLAARLVVADTLRDTAAETIDLLRRQGIRRVAMITGDHPRAAAAVAAGLGVDDVFAGLTPDEKQARVLALRAAYGPVLTVGDGVNDAPALAASDVGAAMGAAGSDAALETADLALMSDELLKLPFAVRLARATLRNIRTNVAVSLALKGLFLLLAVAGSATLWMAVLADTGASVLVVANALRLLRAR